MKNISKIFVLVFLTFLILGCEVDPKLKKEKEIKNAYAQEMLPCVVMKVITNKRGRVKETYYRCIKNDGIYAARCFLGNEGDTVKVMRQRMYCRQN
jgi:hypothetical protein